MRVKLYVSLISQHMQEKKKNYNIALAIKLLEGSDCFSRNLRSNNQLNALFDDADKKYPK